jgi:hypothetical protein
MYPITVILEVDLPPISKLDGNREKDPTLRKCHWKN